MNINLGTVDITNLLLFDYKLQDVWSINNTYYFDPVSAGIVQGVTDDTTAANNVAIINSEIAAAQSAGKTVFELPAMDAYFNPEGTNGSGNKFTNESTAIIIPSNFHFKMNSNTIMRVQPTDWSSYCLFSMNSNLNIQISGGILIGDKYTHTYRQDYTVSSAATTTTAIIKLEREYVATLYNIPVTVSDVNTNASEIASYLDTLPDITATAIGAIITIVPDPGLFVKIDDDVSDTSGINFTGHSTHEWGYGIQLYGVHDSNIIGVTAKWFTGDMTALGITGLRNPADGTLNGNLTCENVLIEGCTADGNRRQGFSIVDCNGVTVNNCIIKNTGQDIYTLPSFGIDLEAYRERDAGGNLLEYARVENVTITNNTFIDNLRGDIDIFNPRNVTVAYNTMSTSTATISIANNACYDVIIHHNTINGSGLVGQQGIAINSNIVAITSEELTHDIQIYNNTIDSCQYALSVSGDIFTVHDNIITNVIKIGINLGDDLKNGTFYNNNVSSSISGATGIRNFLIATSMDSVTMDNETCNMTNGTGIKFQSLTANGTGLTITNSSFTGTTKDVDVTNSSNITFSGCTYTTVTDTGNTNVTIP